MWWVFLMLSHAIQALPPSDNSISFLASNACEKPYVCKSAIQCSIWYNELQALPPKPCFNSEGYVGLCCPDVAHIKPTVSKETGKEELLPPVQSISPILLEFTARAARSDLSYLTIIEEILGRNEIVMHENSMARTHSVSVAPFETTRSQSQKALLVVSATRRLQEKLALSPERAGFALQAIDTRLSFLEDTCPLLPTCFLRQKYRSFDGTCNNLRRPSWGIWDPKIRKSSKELPNVRVVRTTVVKDENHPAVDMTHMLMQWGQFIDHDMVQVPVFQTANQSNIECCTPEGGILPSELRHPHCFPIDIPVNDPFYGPRGIRCLNFVRSMITPRTECRMGYADQMNQLTHFIDASHVYGPSPVIAANLRQFVGGLMKTSFIEGRQYPLQDFQGKNCVGLTRDTGCFVAGDTRVNQIMTLTSLHIIFLRQHNYIATALNAINPHWSDEIIYQETRRIIGALMQHITYNEFLPSILGRQTMEIYGLTPQSSGYSSSYDENVNPSITNEFAAAAFRMGHSLIQGSINLVEEDGKVRVELMRNWFNNPHLLRQSGQLDAVLRGMIDQWPQNMDEWVSEDLTNHLFQRPKRDFGLDLISINLWRGRDHGLPGYNTYRQVCGLPPVTSFQELLKIMDRSVVNRLASVYRSVDDIDLYIGGLVEHHLPSSMLGPVFSCIIAEQFARSKEGDRFFYEHGGQPYSFTPAQLQEIRKMSLAAIICDNADNIVKVQPLVFRHPSPTNPRVNCKSPIIPRMNLAAWTG
ncbi:Chorion peroxidase [Daphnia magna]|uniref:Chorion peroxidase n=1 Tax=Daphnia magna TaxID=35525 RepID=A0A162Q0A9_9CRUS|nr:Chorion peroxidase [Daphnia magna]